MFDEAYKKNTTESKREISVLEKIGVLLLIIGIPLFMSLWSYAQKVDDKLDKISELNVELQKMLDEIVKDTSETPEGYYTLPEDAYQITEEIENIIYE